VKGVLSLLLLLFKDCLEIIAKGQFLQVFVQVKKEVFVGKE